MAVAPLVYTPLMVTAMVGGCGVGVCTVTTGIGGFSSSTDFVGYAGLIVGITSAAIVLAVVVDRYWCLH